jgi:hypothetical protein
VYYKCGCGVSYVCRTTVQVTGLQGGGNWGILTQACKLGFGRPLPGNKKLSIYTTNAASVANVESVAATCKYM